MDGSPLAGTALLREPYTAKFPGKEADYKGFTNATDEDLYNFLDRWYPQRFQIQVHVNGDGTADQFIRVVERIVKKYGMNEGKVVMIHCSLVQEDQLVKLKQLGVYPSFYSTTLAEGAESFAEQIGDRINRMSPAAWAAKHGMIYTIHNDEPLISMEIMPLVWAAVTRTSKITGKVYGADMALTPYQALLAVTRYAAIQLGEGGNKGSIEKGKRADFVVLDKDPLKVDPKTLKDIVVIETIKDGKSVYTRK
jgi:hypothetical protein